MTPDGSGEMTDRVVERRRAVAAGEPLPAGRGSDDRPDRRPTRSLAGDDQGVLLRPDWREGPSGQGPLPGGVPRLWRLHAAAQRQGRRVRVLQGVPPRRDRAPLDARPGAGRHARVARAVRPAAIVLRQVTHARAPTWGRGARATEGRRLALPERRDRRL